MIAGQSKVGCKVSKALIHFGIFGRAQSMSMWAVVALGRGPVLAKISHSSGQHVASGFSSEILVVEWIDLDSAAYKRALTHVGAKDLVSDFVCIVTSSRYLTGACANAFDYVFDCL